MGSHTLVSDKTTEPGGSNAEPTPYDLSLAGLGTCTAITLRMYGDRKQRPLEAVEVAFMLLSEKHNRSIERAFKFQCVNDEQTER